MAYHGRVQIAGGSAYVVVGQGALQATDGTDEMTQAHETTGKPTSPVGPEGDVHFPAFLREDAAYRARLPELLEAYEGQFVAIRGGEVVDHDADRFPLARRVRSAYGRSFVLIRRVSRHDELVEQIDTPGVLD